MEAVVWILDKETSKQKSIIREKESYYIIVNGSGHNHLKHVYL
jgi:hypothetical protein